MLATLRDDYVRGMTDFRRTGATDSDAAHAARGAWIGTFARGVVASSAQAAMLTEELVDLRQEWTTRLESARAEKDMTRGVASD